MILLGLKDEEKVSEINMYYAMLDPKEVDLTMEQLKTVLLYVYEKHINDMWVSELLANLLPDLVIRGFYSEEKVRGRFAKGIVDDIGEAEYGKVLVRFVDSAKETLSREIVNSAKGKYWGKAKICVRDAGRLISLIYTELGIPWGDYPLNDKKRYEDVSKYILEEVNKGIPSSLRKDMLLDELKNRMRVNTH